MSSKEITHLIERMEMIEERIGISISGLYASVNDQADSDGDYRVKINGGVDSQSGSNLHRTILLKIVCQNDKGQIIGTKNVFIMKDLFLGYHVFSESVNCKAYPTRIKIVPEQ